MVLNGNNLIATAHDLGMKIGGNAVSVPIIVRMDDELWFCTHMGMAFVKPGKLEGSLQVAKEGDEGAFEAMVVRHKSETE